MRMLAKLATTSLRPVSRYNAWLRSSAAMKARAMSASAGFTPRAPGRVQRTVLSMQAGTSRAWNSSTIRGRWARFSVVHVVITLHAS